MRGRRRNRVVFLMKGMLMESEVQRLPVSKGTLWTGRVLSALPALMMGVGAIPALINPASMQEGFSKYGYPPEYLRGIILVELLSVILYVIPQTAVLGAILLTGYLGGAVATHVRVGELGISAIPVTVGVVVWLGLFLRDRRLWALVPLRRG